MQKWFLILLLTLGSYLQADWLPAGQLIPPGNMQSSSDVFVVYYPKTDVVVATWRDSDTLYPYYALFDGTSWTSGAPITNSSFVNSSPPVPIVTTYDENHQTIMAVWISKYNALFYSQFDGTSWTTEAPIPLGTSTQAYNVVLTYDSNSSEVVAVWAENFPLPGTNLFYSTFGSSSTWSAGSDLQGITDADTPSVAYDTATQKVMALWDNSSQELVYSLYNGSAWTAPQTFLSGGISPWLTYNSNNQTLVATWLDSTDDLPKSAVYNGSWGSTISIPFGISSGVYNSIRTAYDPISKNVFAAWQDVGNDFPPIYSIFNGSSWTPGALIPPGNSIGVQENIYLSYHIGSNQMVATWNSYFPEIPLIGISESADPTDRLPYYSLYNNGLLPPSNLTGKAFYNIFLTQKDWVVELNWTPSSSPDVVAYRIYRNNIFIGEVSSPTTQFIVNGQKKGVAATYGVTSVNSNGLESSPTTITVP